MAVKRKRYSTGRGGKSSKRPALARQDANLLAALKKQQKKIEYKFFDLDIDDAVIASAGTIAQASCNLITQGTGDSNRLGRACTVTSISWRYRVRLENQTQVADGTDVIRLVLYLDKQSNGATAAVTDILESANYQSFLNLANKKRFRILHDCTMAISTGGAAGENAAFETSPKEEVGAYYGKVSIPLEFDASAGVITDLTSNNIGVLTISEQSMCSLDSKMRLRFID